MSTTQYEKDDPRYLIDINREELHSILKLAGFSQELANSSVRAIRSLANSVCTEVTCHRELDTRPLIILVTPEAYAVHLEKIRSKVNRGR